MTPMPGRLGRNALQVAARVSESRAFALAIVAAACLELIAYSQTVAYYRDEGFDLLAAQLVVAGKKPYVDFFYQHTPFFTYLTAGWMWLFGQGWRSAHALSAIFASGTVLLAVGYVWPQRSDRRSSARTLAVSAVVLLIASQYLVMRYATTAQAYGACLFFAFAGFRFAAVTVDRPSAVHPVIAGFCCGAAAASSLLAAPLLPIVLVWLSWHAEPNQRLRVATTFTAGAVVPFAPLFWLLWHSPYAVIFDTVSYHVWHRSNGWPLDWDLTVLGSGLDSAQCFLLVLLAGIGLASTTGIRVSPERDRRERQLCAAIALGLAIFAAISRPTLEQYFVLAIPFMAILASFGALRVASFEGFTFSQRSLFAVLAALSFLITPARLFHKLSWSGEHMWQSLDAIGSQIDRVTPKDGQVLASQIIYAAARRLPPTGLETAVRIVLPADVADSVHLVSRRQVEEWARAGRFDTICNCDGTQSIEYLGLKKLYRQSVRLSYLDTPAGACDIFWDRMTPAGN